MSRRRRRKNNASVFAIIIVLLMLSFAVSYKKIELDSQDNKYREKIEEFNTLIEQEIVREAEIEELKVFMQTKRYVEEVAREKLGLVYKDEIVFREKSK